MREGITKQEAEDIKGSRIWELIEKEIEYQIEQTRNELELAIGADIIEAQDRLKALRGLYRLPQDAIDREE